MGNDKVIPLSTRSNELSRSITFSMTSRDNWTIEKFPLLPYFEGASLNIENCSLEVELIQIEEYQEGDDSKDT